MMDIEAVQIGGNDVDVDDISAAYRQLETLASAQRAASPWLTASQAFAQAGDARPDLLARALRRPAPTTNYPFPK
jgi:hypothetical protein